MRYPNIYIYTEVKTASRGIFVCYTVRKNYPGADSETWYTGPRNGLHITYPAGAFCYNVRYYAISRNYNIKDYIQNHIKLHKTIEHRLHLIATNFSTLQWSKTVIRYTNTVQSAGIIKGLLSDKCYQQLKHFTTTATN